MYVMNVNDREDSPITSYPYRGKPLRVTGVSIRWLSKAGPEGAPEYGLRYFTVAPGGEIPIHNHLYVQTMYILDGRLSVASYDSETDQLVEEKVMGPTDFVFVPSMEPHSMKNLSDTESAHFSCCIANVYQEETV
jgi:quercetin dioxygenase-like cupin family protein